MSDSANTDSDSPDSGSKDLGNTDSGNTARARRTVLLGGTALLAAACSPLGSADDDATTGSEPDDSPESLALLSDDQPLVDDGQGNTEPLNDGPLIDPDAEPVADIEPDDDRRTTTTAAVAATVTTIATPNTGRPATTRRPATTSRPATTPSTAAPTTSLPGSVPSTTAPSTTAPATTAPSTTAPAPTSTSTTAAPTTTAPPPPPPPAASARLVTSRLTFGITPEVDSDITMNGIDAWVADQLARSQADENVENLLSDYPNLRRSPLEIWNALSDNGRVGWEHIHAQLVRARYSSNQLFEMMTHLWMDHFNISFGGNDQALTFAYQENVIRPNSMGRFVDLLVATAESGSMMIYLDNARSDARQGINENYGRELLELHTLGIDRQGAQIYTEEDVAGVAHVMSGWAAERSRNQPNWGQFVYRPEFHSTDSVSILGGQWSNAGLAGKAAGDNLLQFLARHPQTANYVAWKICRRFVSDEPSEALIASAAQVYLANDTDIVAVLRHVFASAEFVNSGGQKARRPFEILVAAMRSLGSSLPVDPLGDAAGDLNFALNRMGHEPWSWETPDGFPDDARSWVNSNSLLISWELTSRMARDRLTRPDDASPLITPLNVLRGGSTNAGELFERLTFRCNLGDLPDGLRDQLLGLVNATADTPIDDVSDDALAELVSFLLAHPLFQLR